MHLSMRCSLREIWIPELADRFVAMWVNDLTLDYTERGREAVRLLLDEGFERGIIPTGCQSSLPGKVELLLPNPNLSSAYNINFFWGI